MSLSVQPEWCRALPLQQQSTLMLAGRGPDGIGKDHPVKDVQRAYRGSVLVAARYGRELHWGEHADSFMSLELIADPALWVGVVERYFQAMDSLPHHYIMHLLHAAEILGYKHPKSQMRSRWYDFYVAGVEDMHLQPESEFDMDIRLSDWGQADWPEPCGDPGSGIGCVTPNCTHDDPARIR